MNTLKLVFSAIVILASYSASALDIGDKQFEKDLLGITKYKMCALEVKLSSPDVAVSCDDNKLVAWSLMRGYGASTVAAVGSQILKLKFSPNGCFAKGDTAICIFTAP